MDQERKNKLPLIVPPPSPDFFFNDTPKAPKQTLRKKMLLPEKTLTMNDTKEGTQRFLHRREELLKQSSLYVDGANKKNEAIVNAYKHSIQLPQVSRPSSATIKGVTRTTTRKNNREIDIQCLNEKLEKLYQEREETAGVAEYGNTFKPSWI